MAEHLSIIMPQDEVYISFDVEAFGPIPGTFSMTSLGACVSNDQSKTFYRVFKPITDNVELGTIDIHNITVEYAKKDGVEPSEGIKDFVNWCRFVAGGRRIVLVSFGEFDYMYLKWYLVTYGYPEIGGPNWLDMKSMIKGALNCKWGETVKRKIPPHFFGSARHTHNALDDAIEQAQLFENLLAFGNKINS